MRSIPILSLLFLLACADSHGQSTKGTEFWFSYIQNLIQAAPQVYISSENNVNGTVEIPGIGWSQNFIVNAGTTQTVTLPTDAVVPYTNGLHQLAVHLVACDSVTVYAVFPGAYSSDATVVFPKNSLGSEYTVLNMTGSPGDWGDAAQIVATEDNTVIEITPSVTTDGGQPAGVPFTVTLNEGDVYQLTHLPGNADLTGTRVVGMNIGECKPFAVFSGSQCINIGGCTACDQIYDMLIPNSNLGSSYGLVPLAQKGQTIYRVMAIENGTQVSVDGALIATLNAGQFHQFANNTFSYLTSTNPVMVAQFARGVSCDNTGDPFKVSIFPIEQSINSITFNAFQTPIVNNFWVNIVSPTTGVGEVTLDGANIGGQFNPFPANGAYSYARINIAVGDHTLNSRDGILATVYGWGGAESFGYCAGAAMKDLTNDFTIESTPACAGEPITFTAVTDPATVDYLWDFGDGSPQQSGITAVHSYAQNDSYTVTLTKVKSNQCDINIIKPVDIIDPPISISQNDTSLCLGEYIDLIVPVNEPFEIPRINGCGDTISVLIVMEYDSIHWSTGHVGDSIRITPTTDTVIYVYGEQFDSQCVAIDSIIIRVVDIVADLAVSNACLLDSACIQNLSISSSPLTTSSYFINDSLLAQDDPLFCFRYHSPGVHDLKLLLVHPVGCSDSITMPIEIYAHPSVSFTFNDPCDTDSVLFAADIQDNGHAVTDHMWDFTSDGQTDEITPNTGHVYPSEGTYDVTLIAVNEHGCADTARYPLTVHPLPIAGFSAETVCLNDSTVFQDLSSIVSGDIVSWLWYFDDGGSSADTMPVHLYALDGSYAVSLTVESDFGCLETYVDTVTVAPLPLADFVFDDQCTNDPMAFTNTSVGAVAYSWDFSGGAVSEDTDPSYTYTDAGTYDVQLIASTAFGCVDTVMHEVTIHPLPMAGFINDTVCARLPTAFTDTSVVDTGAVAQWFWDFDDGGSSTQQHPTHIFMVGGTYDVKLRVTTDEGCLDSITRTVIVHAKPDADFTWTDECLNDVSQFIDASAVAGGAVVKWDWDFDDGGTSATQDTTYIFSSSGTYDVTLMVETDLGCRDTVTHVAEVYDLPVALFGVQDVCLYDPALFVNASSIPSGSIVQNLWDLGEGTLLDTMNPLPHHYPMHGLYDVELITVSSHGCRDTMLHGLEIFPVPVADFTFDTVCFPLPTQFTDLSTIAGNGVIGSWDWKFGDGNTNTTDQNPLHFYDSWGDYEVILTVTSADGCVDAVTIGPARVHPKPTAIFRNNIANCHEDSTYFNDLSTLDNFPNDSLVQWSWTFGDGYSADVPDPDHLYGDEGFYDVTLAVMSNHSCVDTVTHTVEIYPLPRVAFTVDTTRGCQPFRVQFYDQTTIPMPYSLASWQWDFGDGTDSVFAQFPINTYHTDSLGPFDEGVFTVSLVVTSGNGCISSATYEDYITEYPKPHAWFDVDPKRAELLFARMKVTDLSSPNVVDWDWDMGDGTWYDVQHPVHRYQDTGTFVITQYVSTQYGCLDTAEFAVIVDPEFYFYIPNTFTPNNDLHNPTFFGTGVGVAEYQMLIFDRWGSQIFESGDMDLHWDGTKNGHPVQQGVYAYIFNIVDIKGHSHQYVGHVNLVR